MTSSFRGGGAPGSTASFIRRRPTLRREILFGFSFLAAAALSVAVLSALLASTIDPTLAFFLLAALIAADVLVVFFFGNYLLKRLILRPVAALNVAAREIAGGNLRRRAPEAETQDFTDLASQFNEMTERLLGMQGQLITAEKLASIGRLAAGVAHEVGNPLSAIATYVEVLRKRGGDPELLNSISRECGRIDAIVRDLLEFARPSQEDAGPVDVVAAARGAIQLLQRQGGLNGIDVRFESLISSASVVSRFHSVEQVVVNLVLNARDAAPGGLVAVRLERWIFDPAATHRPRKDEPAPPARPSGESRPPLREDLAPGTPGVLLVVADSGPGVPAENRGKIFDPFFTTKEPGAGTGLGLAIVQRIVHELGGMVWVDAAREGGAAFKVFLPATGIAEAT